MWSVAVVVFSSTAGGGKGCERRCNTVAANTTGVRKLVAETIAHAQSVCANCLPGSKAAAIGCKTISLCTPIQCAFVRQPAIMSCKYIDNSFGVGENHSSRQVITRHKQQQQQPEGVRDFVSKSSTANGCNTQAFGADSIRHDNLHLSRIAELLDANERDTHLLLLGAHAFHVQQSDCNDECRRQMRLNLHR